VVNVAGLPAQLTLQRRFDRGLGPRSSVVPHHPGHRTAFPATRRRKRDRAVTNGPCSCAFWRSGGSRPSARHPPSRPARRSRRTPGSRTRTGSSRSTTTASASRGTTTAAPCPTAAASGRGASSTSGRSAAAPRTACTSRTTTACTVAHHHVHQHAVLPEPRTDDREHPQRRVRLRRRQCGRQHDVRQVGSVQELLVRLPTA